MEKFTKLTGVAAPLPIVNVDTDMIIPKDYLKTIKRTGLGTGLFAEMRYNEDGSENPDFVLNKPAYRKAQILVAGDNFGCGSSREHAPQALHRWGIRAIAGVSFGEIFSGNSATIGLPCVLLTPVDAAAARAAVDADPALEVVVDLERSELRAGSLRWPVTINESQRRRFVAGNWDTLSTLSEAGAAISAVAQRLPYLHNWHVAA